MQTQNFGVLMQLLIVGTLCIVLIMMVAGMVLALLGIGV